jgi:hypothetical protein
MLPILEDLRSIHDIQVYCMLQVKKGVAWRSLMKNLFEKMAYCLVSC